MPDGDNDPECQEDEALYNTNLPKVHIVKKGETLSIIADEYDLDAIYDDPEERSYDALYRINKCDRDQPKGCTGPLPTNQDGSDCMWGTVNQICPGQQIQLPQRACGTLICGKHGFYK